MFKMIHLGNEDEIFEAEIAIVPLQSLYVHEEIIEEYLTKLIRLMSKSGVFKHPIIVDKNSGVILDGMHRYTALKRLGYDYIVAYLVDYNHSSIQIGRWHREIEGTIPVNFLREIESKLSHFFEINGEFVRVSFETLEEDMNSRKAAFGIYVEERRELYGFYCDVKDIHEFFYMIRKTELMIRNKLNNANMRYFSDEFLKNLESRPYRGGERKRLIIIVPRITKREVVYYATRGRIFPPKTTRHIIPIRPLFVNYPMNLLRKSGYDLDFLNQVLSKMLSQRRILKVRGKVYIDRFYEDDYLIIFS